MNVWQRLLLCIALLMTVPCIIVLFPIVIAIMSVIIPLIAGAGMVLWPVIIIAAAIGWFCRGGK